MPRIDQAAEVFADLVAQGVGLRAFLDDALGFAVLDVQVDDCEPEGERLRF